ncbi:MAG: calcium-binding protein, partial [Deltaproteobacteria bacterium]|nr:calcium-binding protein [Deltaproteobacteria bacterium]
GGTGTDTLTQADGSNTWAVTGADAGTVTDLGGTWSAIENLTGGSDADTFTIGASGTLTGIIAGGGGTDTLVQTDGTNAWSITGADSGDVTDIGSFTAIENLTGGSADDTFEIASGATLSGSIEGGTGTDSLTQADGTNNWVITGTGAGTVTDVGGTFSSIEDVFGGIGVDIFDFNAAATIDIDAGGGADIINLDQAITGMVTGGMGDDIVYVDTGGSVTTLTGGADRDTLTAPDGGVVVNITAAEAGNIGGVQAWSQFENVTGGANDDTLNIASGGSLSGNISGGGGTDTLTQADGANTWVVTGANAGTVTDIGGTWNTIENLTGGTGADGFTINSGATLSGSIAGGTGTDTLTQADGTNAWVITGTGAGTVPDLGGTFSSIEDLFGGTGVDTFDFNAPATIDINAGGDDDIVNLDQLMTGTLSGGTGNDMFNLSAGLIGSILGDAGTDVVDINGAVDIGSNDLSINAETLTNTSGSITADQLSIIGATSIGAPGLRMQTSINTLQITSSNANTYITESNGVDLLTINVGGFSIDLAATSGNITNSTGQTIRAYNAILTAEGTGAAIGTSTKPVITDLSGALTATANNGNGGIFIEDAGNLVIGSIDAATGTVELTAATGTIKDLGGTETIPDITSASLRIRDADGVGISATNALNLDVGNLVIDNSDGAVYITDADGMGLGTVNTAGFDLNIRVITGNLTSNGSDVSSRNLTLTSTTGGIGIGGSINTTTTGTIMLASGGTGAAGNIGISETTAQNTSNMTIVTTGGGVKEISLAASSINVDNAFGKANYDLYLTASTGNITDRGGNLTADSLVLAANSAGSAIGSSASPVNININGGLTASANNGAGGIYIKDSGALEIASIIAGAGDVGLEAAGRITDAAGNDTATDVTANNVIVRNAAGIGNSAADALNLNVANLTVQNSSGDVFITNTGTLGLGTVNANARALYVRALSGSLTDNTSALTGGTITLIAPSGIGTNSAVQTSSSVLDLSSGTGDIDIYSTNALSTSNLNFSTGGGTQTVSYSAPSFNIDSAFGNSTDHFSLTARTGNITGNETLTANDLNLTALADGASIGTHWNVTPSGGYIADTSSPINILVSGNLTADASNGSGGIFLNVPTSGDRYNPNNLVYASIDAGETGDIEIVTDMYASINGSVTPSSFDTETKLPEYTNMDYDTPNLDNMIRGNEVVIEAGTIGLTNSPQMDVVNMLLRLQATGKHPAGEAGTWSGVVSVRDPDPTIITEANHGGRLERYPISIDDIPNRIGDVQVGNYVYRPDTTVVYSQAIQAATTSIVGFSPQQEALEELLSKTGGEDFFMAPPLWIDIQMEEEEEEEFEEGEDEFTLLKEHKTFGEPGLKNGLGMPSLLVKTEAEKRKPIRLSYLR